MKKRQSLMVYVLIIAIVLTPAFAQAFNPATHLYIAERVFPNTLQKFDLYYGAIAPDIAFYVSQPEKWNTAFEDTHYDYINLRPFALSSTQRAFANGWLTHNEAWGADYFSHVMNPVGPNVCITTGYYQGYVIEKACLLSSQTGIDIKFAHYAIETAIDILIKRNVDVRVGEKLLKASLLRSSEDLNLLIRVFVLRERRTDLVSLASAELAFRNIIMQYAMALSLPSPWDEENLAKLGVKMAKEMYGITITPEDVLNLLRASLNLCKSDYMNVIEATISGIKSRL